MHSALSFGRDNPVAVVDPSSGLLDPVVFGHQSVERELFNRHPQTVACMRAVFCCAYCSRSFQEINNLGMWKCSYHPGTTGAGNSRGHITQTCCGQPLGSRGCRPCDHAVSRIYDDCEGRVTTRVPAFVLRAARNGNVSLPIDATCEREPDISWKLHDIRAEQEICPDASQADQEYHIATAATSTWIIRADYYGIGTKQSTSY